MQALIKAAIERSTSDSYFEQTIEQLSNSNIAISWGETYSIKELHKAIRDGFPVLAEFGGKLIALIGDDDSRFLAHYNGDDLDLTDGDFKKHYLGKAIIINGEREEKESQEDETPERIIFVPERDTWPRDLDIVKNSTMAQIRRMDKLDAAQVPRHPVIVSFRAPGEKESKEHILAMVQGADITLYASDDPVAQFFHELGHIYWQTSLKKEERETFETIRKEMKSVPSIFGAEHNSKNGEELFCSVYQWYIRGVLINNGYRKILEYQCPEGVRALNEIFNRNAREMNASANWEEQSRKLAAYAHSLDAGNKVAVIGNQSVRYIKKALPIKPPVDVVIPSDIQTVTLGEYRDRRWIRIQNGRLANTVLPMNKAGYVDVEYMQRYPKKFQLVPVETLIKTKDGKTYMRAAYKRPEMLAPVVVENSGENKSIVSKILNWIKNA